MDNAKQLITACETVLELNSIPVYVHSMIQSSDGSLRIMFYPVEEYDKLGTGQKVDTSKFKYILIRNIV